MIIFVMFNKIIKQLIISAPVTDLNESRYFAEQELDPK